MKTLTIKDLSRTEELDRPAMAGVCGGMLTGYFPAWSSVYDTSKHDFSLNVQQLNSQTQNIANNNGVNVAFADNIRTTIKPTQTASNSISF